MKKIVFSKHAATQLVERSISRESVLTVLREFDKSDQQLNGRTSVVKKFIEGTKIYARVVIYEESLEKIEIVTTFVTSKTKKYL